MCSDCQLFSQALNNLSLLAEGPSPWSDTACKGGCCEKCDASVAPCLLHAVCSSGEVCCCMQSTPLVFCCCMQLLGAQTCVTKQCSLSRACATNRLHCYVSCWREVDCSSQGRLQQLTVGLASSAGAVVVGAADSKHVGLVMW
jgi:hypothetical protein